MINLVALTLVDALPELLGILLVGVLTEAELIGGPGKMPVRMW
jgi:hypothetical protein